MPAPTMTCAPPIAVGQHKPPETKLLAIHPTHAQTTPQHQMISQPPPQQQQNQQCQLQQQNGNNKPGKSFYQIKLLKQKKKSRLKERRKKLYETVNYRNVQGKS